MAKRYWLMKCEPSAYSIDDLERDRRAEWEGVRNYQARNFMRDEMQLGDLALFYHSNAKPSGVVGLEEICKASYPDFHAFDKRSKYYDPKSKHDAPTWFMVDVKFIEKFADLLPLETLKQDPALTGMMVLKRGSRLSVQPVEKKHFERVVTMGRK